MDLVDDENLVLCARWSAHDFVTQVAHVFDAVVTGGIYFDDVEMRLFTIGKLIDFMGKDTGYRCFADPTWAG